MAITMSGTTMTLCSVASMKRFPKNVPRRNASASSVPSAVEKAVLIAASMRVITVACCAGSLCASAPYQSVVKPRHSVPRGARLKDCNTTTAIGA